MWYSVHVLPLHRKLSWREQGGLHLFTHPEPDQETDVSGRNVCFLIGFRMGEKVKSSLSTPWMHTVYWKFRSLIPAISSRWRGVVSFTLRLLYPQQYSLQYPLTKTLAEFQTQFGRLGILISFFHAGSRTNLPWSPGLWYIYYTNWATLNELGSYWSVFLMTQNESTCRLLKYSSAHSKARNWLQVSG